MLSLHLHSYGRFDQRSPIGPSSWPHFDLLYFHEGSARLEIDRGRSETFHAGQGILFYPNTRFAGTAVSETVLASVQHFAIDAPADSVKPPPPLDRLLGKQRSYLPLRNHPRLEVEADIDRAMRLAAQSQSDQIQVIRTSLLLIILAQLLVQPSQASHYGPEQSSFGDLLTWAQNHFDQGVSVASLAAMAGLSESRFRARFSSEMGISAGRYLLNLRLNEGKRLLRETRQPVKSIAQSLGYSDVVAFHRAFKRREGLTPSEYRSRYAPRG